MMGSHGYISVFSRENSGVRCHYCLGGDLFKNRLKQNSCQRRYPGPLEPQLEPFGVLPGC